MDIKKIIKKSVATVLTEASKERMIAQIERAEKEGTSIYKLPKATQDFYNKVYKKSANESKFFRLPSKLNVMWDLKNSVNAMVSKHDSGDDYDPAVMKTIEDLIKKIKKSAKAFNSAEDVKGTLYETSLRKVFNATKKGNFPVTLVAIENGKVVDQKLVGTREIVPAAFNAMQEDYPKAQINVEDRTGKILFSESK